MKYALMTKQEISPMLRKSLSKQTPVLLDSDPFLLLLIGHYDRNMIGKVKRLKHYRPIHYDLLFQFLAGRKIFITSGILAEVSNLSKICVGSSRFKPFLEAIIPQLQQTGEYEISKDVIIENPAFPRLGYTDTSIVVAGTDKEVEIVTADFPLYSRCNNLGLKIIHMKMFDERASQFT